MNKHKTNAKLEVWRNHPIWFTARKDHNLINLIAATLAF